jgi:Skp family chaperone for outer membrane proteins/TolB-like protein
LTAFFGLALFAGRPALSQTPGKRLAVLEFNGAKTQGEVLEVFADTVRGGVVQGLAGRGIQVMTRENMMVLLREMGKNDCVEGDCEVETARNIGADFVISGSVVLVDQSFVVTLKLHESKGGSLLAVDQVSAQSQVEVLRQLREAGRRIVADNLGPRPAAPAAVRPGEPAAASWARAGRAVPGTAPTLIALVDLARLIKETPEGQAVRAKLKAVFDQKQRRLDDMQGELKKRIEAFKRDRGSLSPEAIAKGEASLQQEVTRIQDVYKTYQKELGDSEAELSKKLIDGTITPRLRALALASGSPTMLDAKAVAYFQRELDLTESAAARAASASLKPVRIARIDQKKVLTSVHEGVRAKAGQGEVRQRITCDDSGSSSKHRRAAESACRGRTEVVPDPSASLGQERGDRHGSDPEKDHQCVGQTRPRPRPGAGLLHPGRRDGRHVWQEPG